MSIHSFSLPAQRVRPARLPDVKSPAIVLPADEWDLPFIVAGEGDQAVACFLGDRYTFQGMPLKEASNFKGLAVEGVEFEVDLKPMHSLEAGRPTAGALVRAGDELQLVYQAENRYPGFLRVPLLRGLDAASSGTEIAFHAWSAVITERDEKLVVWRKTAPE